MRFGCAIASTPLIQRAHVPANYLQLNATIAILRKDNELLRSNLAASDLRVRGTHSSRLRDE